MCLIRSAEVLVLYITSFLNLCLMFIFLLIDIYDELVIYYKMQSTSKEPWDFFLLIPFYQESTLWQLTVFVSSSIAYIHHSSKSFISLQDLLFSSLTYIIHDWAVRIKRNNSCCYSLWQLNHENFKARIFTLTYIMSFIY